MKELNRIYNEDCLIGMKEITDKSIDCIICDLPYGVLNKKTRGGQWDSNIPFEELWKEYRRIIKDNGAIILFGQGMFTANLMKSAEDIWRYNLIWKKGNSVSGFLNSKRMPLRNHEDICVFYKSLPTYNPQMTKGEPTHNQGTKGKVTRNCYGEHELSTTNYDDNKYPKSVIDFQKEYKGNCIHPTQKPLGLIEWLVKTYSNEGDLILDNCMGSGTTAIACINTNRNYIGFELDNEYYEKSLERIRNNF